MVVLSPKSHLLLSLLYQCMKKYLFFMCASFFRLGKKRFNLWEVVFQANFESRILKVIDWAEQSGIQICLKTLTRKYSIASSIFYWGIKKTRRSEIESAVAKSTQVVTDSKRT